MSTGAADGDLRERARSLLQRTGTHPVISLYLDLDPEQFPTPKARESQTTSLVDRCGELAKSSATGFPSRFDKRQYVPGFASCAPRVHATSGEGARPITRLKLRVSELCPARLSCRQPVVDERSCLQEPPLCRKDGTFDLRFAVKDDPLPVLLQVRTELQLGPGDPVNDRREEATPRAGHVTVGQHRRADPAGRAGAAPQQQLA